MKKIFFSIVALAALAACTKSEVAYEASAEIGFAPAVKNVTKAANESGVLDASNDLGIWAFWNGVNGSVEETKATYANYTDSYLANALFVNRTSTANWGGETSYPWPTNGALVFAGYNKPEEATFSASYSFLDNTETTDVNEENTMTFTNYTQSNLLAETFDLCWFGRTNRSYNNRTDGAPVAVTMSHALTWVTIKVKGDESTAGTWVITGATLKGVKTVGTGTCVFNTVIVDDEETLKASATWVSNTPADMDLTEDEPYTLTKTAEEYESVDYGVVVIPQTPVQLEITYQYPVSGVMKDGKTIVNLTLNGHQNEAGQDIPDANNINTWLSGNHYTYTLVFKANEILVAPSYGEWDSVNQSVTVE
ncbi:MAG: hypothetical protein IKW11_05580 [Bacteroidales bacterium]|nr:hypothetical protein [Bacteroidales bacterium]